VEANVIEPVCFTDANDTFPRGNIGGWVAEFWKNSTFECAPEKNPVAVEGEGALVVGDLTETKGGSAAVGAARGFEGDG